MRAGLRRFLFASIGLHVTTSVAVAAGPSLGTPVNVVLILLDDVGVDLVGSYEREYWSSHWEHPTPCTPRIDALAAEGVRFTNAWSSPTCTPTRTQIQTGRPPSRSGMGAVTGPASAERRGLDPKIPTLADLVVNDAVTGKWHMGDESQWPGHPLAMGFARFAGPRFDVSDRQQQDGPSYRDWRRWNGQDCAWEPMTRYATAQTTDDAIDTLAELEAGGSPWYLYVPYNAPHEPFHCPTGAGDEACSSCGEVDWCGTCSGSSSAAHRVRAMVQALDHHVGRLLDAIDADDTAVILLGDNGTPGAASVTPFTAAHAKGTLFQGGVNVPLIIRVPGQVAPYACHALVSVSDLHATIAGLLGVTLPADPAVDSVPLQRWLLPGYAQDPVRAFVHAEMFAPTFRPVGDGLAPAEYRALFHARAVRNERYKLIESYASPSASPTRALYRLYSADGMAAGTPLPHDPAWLDVDADPLSSAFELVDLWPSPDQGECPEQPDEVQWECQALRAALEARPRLPLGHVAELAAREVRSVGRPLACCGTTRPTTELATSCSTTSILVGGTTDARGEVENRTFLEFDVSSLAGIAGLTVHGLELSVAVASGGEAVATALDVCPATSDVSDHDTSPAGCVSLFRSAAGNPPYSSLARWREGEDLCSPLTRTVSLNAAAPALLDAIHGDGRFSLALVMAGDPDDLVTLQTIEDVGSQADVHELRVTYTSEIGRGASPAAEGAVPRAHRREPAAAWLSGVPNPAGPNVTIRFALERPGSVTLRVYDVAGACRGTLVDGAALVAGTHAVPWDARDASGRALPSGVYFLRLDADGTVDTRSTTLVR